MDDDSSEPCVYRAGRVQNERFPATEEIKSGAGDVMGQKNFE